MLEPKKPETEIEHSDVEEIEISTEPTSKNNDDPKVSETEEELLSGAGSEEIEEEEEETEEEEEHSSESHNYDSESSVDDSDLLKRLDEKYGKLPAHSDGDEPESDDIEDDDEDIDPTWTST